MSRRQIEEEIHAIGGSDAGLCAKDKGYFYAPSETASGFEVVKMLVIQTDDAKGITQWSIRVDRAVSEHPNLSAAKAAARRRNSIGWRGKRGRRS